MKCRTSQKKLSGLPGGAGTGHCTIGGGICWSASLSPAMFGDGVSGGAPGGIDTEGLPSLLSRRIYSTVLSKNLAICSSRVSSGVRFPHSHGDHCCGDTSNASAHFFCPPRPGNFSILHCRIFRAIVSRNSSGILPIIFTLPRTVPLLFRYETKKGGVWSRGAGILQPNTGTTDHRQKDGVHVSKQIPV